MNDLNCTKINGKRSPKWNTIAPHFPTRTRNAVEIRWKQIVKGREIDTTFNCPVRAKLPSVVNQTKYLREVTVTSDGVSLHRRSFPDMRKNISRMFGGV
jgi:hypothetical protein